MTLVAMIIFRLRLTIRFASIAKAHWHGCMFDQLRQHNHLKRTFFTAQVARASISGLINILDVFIAKLHELRAICKGVFNSLNMREHQCGSLSGWQQICCVFNKYLRKYYCGTKKYRFSVKKC
jgi:hypothetical protein